MSSASSSSRLSAAPRGRKHLHSARVVVVAVVAGIVVVALAASLTQRARTHDLLPLGIWLGDVTRAEVS